MVIIWVYKHAQTHVIFSLNIKVGEGERKSREHTYLHTNTHTHSQLTDAMPTPNSNPNHNLANQKETCWKPKRKKAVFLIGTKPNIPTRSKLPDVTILVSLLSTHLHGHMLKHHLTSSVLELSP